MTAWQLLMAAGIFLIIVAGISLWFHIKAPKERKHLAIIEPYGFILIVAIEVIIISIIIYYLF
ncbi:MAG: hypothetical protein ACO3UU_00610 [Minisyncoccia bacterium]